MSTSDQYNSFLQPQDTTAPVPESLDVTVEPAIDIFHAAAALEVSGYGDAVASQMGHRDVFTLASVLWSHHQVPAQPPWHAAMAPRMVQSFDRALLIIIGVLISLACLPQHPSTSAIFLTGAFGWISGQATSAGAWQALHNGSSFAAASVFRAAPLLLGLAVIASHFTGMLAPLAWTVWAMSVSVLSIPRVRIRHLTMSLCAALSVALVSFVDHEWGVVAGLIAVFGAAVLAVVTAVRSGAGFQLRSSHVFRAQLLGAGQAASHLGVLWVLLMINGANGFGAIAIAGLLVGALSDPLLEGTQSLVYELAIRSNHLRRARLLAAWIGVCGVVVILVVAVVTAVAMSSFTTASIDDSVIVLSTCVVAAMAATTGLLQRWGRPVAALLFSAPVAAVAFFGVFVALESLALQVLPFIALLAAGAALCAFVVAARAMSRPAAWFA